MSGPFGAVAASLGGSPELRAKYEAFRETAHQALGESLVDHVCHAVCRVHGVEMPQPEGDAPQAVLAYAKRIPFEHTAITDEEAAAVIAELGEAKFVAFSVVAALADAECRAVKVKLPELSA